MVFQQPNINTRKGFDLPTPMAPMQRPQELPQLGASSFTGEIQTKQPQGAEFRGTGATGSFDDPTPQERDADMRRKQQFVVDRVGTVLDKEFALDASKLDDIATRASEEFGLPQDADPALRAMFYVDKKTKEGDTDALKDFRMWRFRRVGRDVAQRAQNFWKTVERMREEYKKEQEDIYADGTKNPFSAAGVTQMAEGALSSMAAAADLFGWILGETVTGGAELVDNLVTNGLVDRKIYSAMESEGAKELMDKIATSQPVEDIMEWAAEHPDAARNVGNALSVAMWTIDALTMWGAGVAAKQAGQRIGKTAIGEGLEQVGKAARELPQRGMAAISDITPGSVKKAGEAISQQTKAARNFLWDITDSAIAQTTGIDPMTKKVALDTWRVGNYFDRLKRQEVSAEDFFDETMAKFDEAAEAISDIGKEYNVIREMKQPVNVASVKSAIDDLLIKGNMSIKKWKIDFTDSALQDRKSQRIVQQAYDNLKKRKEISPSVALNIRNGLDDLVNWKSEVWDRGEKLVKKMRAKYDEIIKDKIPWLRELDKKFAPAREAYDKTKRDFFNKDWSLKDRALSNFRNLVKNPERLKRLSELSDEAGDMSRAILAYEDMQRAMMGKVGTYAKGILSARGIQWVVGAQALWAMWWPEWVNSAPMGVAILAITNPRVMLALLKKIKGVTKKGKLKGVGISKNNLVDELEAKTLDGKFNVKDAEKLQTAIDKNPEIKKELGLDEMDKIWQEPSVVRTSDVVEETPTEQLAATRIETPETQVTLEEWIEVKPEVEEVRIWESATVANTPQQTPDFDTNLPNIGSEIDVLSKEEFNKIDKVLSSKEPVIGKDISEEMFNKYNTQRLIDTITPESDFEDWAKNMERQWFSFDTDFVDFIGNQFNISEFDMKPKKEVIEEMFSKVKSSKNE